jgi:bidirectional [NiFe] hydrogenase diaphorase subunit
MTVKTLVIDGRPVPAVEGETILQLCRDHGIPLPTLCHLEGLSAAAACRLCLVEVKGSPRLQAACVLVAEEGMEVSTATERLQRYRRQIVELLLAERNHACATCVANGRCELQEVACALGVDHVRYPYLHPATALDASHSRFVVDQGRCVLCRRCVRTCDEVEGAHTWDVAWRGRRARVIIDLAQPWGRSESCTSCGKCVQVCPTGALFEKAPASGGAKRREFLAMRHRPAEGKPWPR